MIRYALGWSLLAALAVAMAVTFAHFAGWTVTLGSIAIAAVICAVIWFAMWLMYGSPR